MTSKLDFRGLVEALSTNLLSVTRCDFCALLLPQADRKHLRTTVLYNPEPRGSIYDGAIVPVRGSVCGKVFRTGKTNISTAFRDCAMTRKASETKKGSASSNNDGREGLKSGCELPLIGRNGVVGVLSALSRSERAFTQRTICLSRTSSPPSSHCCRERSGLRKGNRGKEQRDRAKTLSGRGNSG